MTLPLILPGVLVGALFAFITSFDELIVALFLSGSGAITLPRRMWDDLRFAIDPTIAAVSTLTIVLTAALLGALISCAGPPSARSRGPAEGRLDQPSVARGAGEIELDDQVVVVVIAAAVGSSQPQVFSP